MRHIEVEDGLRLRFPGRDAAFAEGVEIGILVAHMAAGRREFALRMAAGTLEQARAVAAGMGYRVQAIEAGQDSSEGLVEVTVLARGRRPRLTLVPSAAKLAAG